MNREDIIRMAREAGIGPVYGYESIERFAALVAAEIGIETHRRGYESGLRDGVAAEREACAKVCDDFERAKWESVKNIGKNGGRLAFAGPMHCAAAIRARGQA